MTLKVRSALLTLLALLFVAISSHAAPKPQITNWKIADGQLVVTVTDATNTKQIVAEPSGMTGPLADPQALIIDGGYAIIYQAPGTAPAGYEGETQSVKHFDVKGARKTLLNEPLQLNRIREVEVNLGSGVRHKLYIVSMQDGGAGIPSLYVVDTGLGLLWKKSAARMSGARNNKLIVALYPPGEEAGYSETQPTRNLYLDLYGLMMQQPGYGFG